ncbi:Tkl protein kinase, partial [Globisporangium splendens]
MTQPLDGARAHSDGEAAKQSAHEQLHSALQAAAIAFSGPNHDEKQRLTTLIAAYCNSVRYAAQRGHGTTDKRKTSAVAAKLLRLAVEIGNLEMVRVLIPQYEDAQTTGEPPLVVTACAFGRLEIAKFLVEHGAAVDAGRAHASPLYAACAGGQLEVVQWLVEEREVALSVPDAHGKTPLVVAIENGSLRIFQYLLFMGADVSESANGGVDVYMMCAYLGNLGMVKHFLELALTEVAYSGCQVHLLEGAVHGEHAEVVEYILQHDDGKISRTDVNENLCIAAQSEDPDVAEVLLNHNADVNHISPRHATPIYRAVTYGNLKTVELLLKRGANITSPASFQAESTLYEMAKHGRVDMLQLAHKLRGDQVDFGARSDNTKHAPLHGAAAHGHTEVACFLLRADLLHPQVDVDVRSANQDTPLLLAVHKGHLEVVDLLVTHGADIDKCRAGHSTPLIEAAEAGHFAVVQYLCEHGADPNAMRDGDLSALCVAARHNFPCIVEYLTKWGRVDPFAFHVAVVEGNIDVVRVLLSLDDTGIDERADLLCQAALRGYLDLVVLLTSRGCNVNGRYSVITGDHHITVTALTAAALSGNLKIVKYLCEHGADIDDVTDEGETALFLAAGKGHEDVVTYLVHEQKANVEFATRYTFTPADIANCMAEHDVLHYLLEHGASAPERHNLDYFSYVVLSREDVTGLTHEQQRDIEVWDRFFAFDMFLKGEYEA